MAAFQATTASTTLLAADPDQWRTVIVSNLGPNTIYLEVGAAAVVASSYGVPTNSASPPIQLPPATMLNVIAATANQVSPADTRLLVS
jgi:hypothetical protein